ncbi:unnamed protein product [Adineta steineri]|uniref:MYND-type domain-containing protein n=1 Tax=Adineta steineri TaxID=433720 RepID=A0A814TZ17_9BILA|nr:unnamed protein product [Adineta steineri]CAF1166656.1 unnamed protein product [Adineta steineri]
MTTVARKSASSQTREQLKDINEDESNTKITIDRNNNAIEKESADVSQDKISINRRKQRPKSTTIRDEYKYVGDIYAEKKHGTGILSWPDKQTYTGAFYADKRHGFGSFQNPEIFEFKGLYRHDERFGPGILMYQSSQCADVGFWLSDDLVRLVYPHPTLNLDIHIIDKKPRTDSSCMLQSWYSPYELLSTIIDFDYILNKKPNALLCKNIENENSTFTQYLIEHADQVQKVMHEKRAQLDAYLSNFNDENILDEKVFNERMVDIPIPNETYEQQQLFYHTNKYLPLKQQATYPIDEILSNNRLTFPDPGPLEKSSLVLLELAYNGEFKKIRDLLLHNQTYVDVCDSRGLTALHFATHNIHMDAINILLDFGANVNQLTDDGLTPLAIAFLFYYGNDPQETINTALEHSDEIILNSKSTSAMEGRQSSPKDNTTTTTKSVCEISIPDEDKSGPSGESNCYGYELTDTLRERMRDGQFRESVHTLIKLLLRRGADPSLSDWPLPVLAEAIRAGDKEMVEILLKKKAQVNCRLNPIRHANLTPLHIACGCLVPTALDIVRLLLEHGAEVNVESSPVDKEYLSLADLSVRDTFKTASQQHGRTPLHIACTREATEDTLSIVRLLLKHQANPNVVCNGQTPLSLAISMGNESLVDTLIEYEGTDPSISLGEGNGNALCTVVSTAYESRWTHNKRLELVERMVDKTPKVLYPVRFSVKQISGSSVDYAYYSFFADTRIAQTPYHILSPDERLIYKERKELLAQVAKRFREEVTKDKDLLNVPIPEHPTGITRGHTYSQRTHTNTRSSNGKSGQTNSKPNNDFHFCATCGRSTGVRLTPCKECGNVYFCSKICKTTGWDAFHQDECQIEQPGDPTAGNKNLTGVDGALLKKDLSSLKTSQNQLPTLSAAKLIRQKRLKKMGNLHPSLEGVSLSWNYTYDAPENYSFS